MSPQQMPPALAFPWSPGTCSSTSTMPLTHCKSPSHTHHSGSHPSFRGCTCWTPQPHVCAHRYHRDNTLACGGQRACHRQHQQCRCSHLLFLLYSGRYHRLGQAHGAAAPAEEMVPVSNPCIHCTAPDWYRNWNEVGQAGTLRRYQVTSMSKKDISEQENSSIDFICSRQAVAERGSNKLLGQ